MSNRIPALLISCFLVAVLMMAVWAPSGAIPTPPMADPLGLAPSLAFETVASGLTGALYVTHAGDGSGRLFIVEQRGTVRVVENDVLQPGFYLDIRDRVQTGGERGLLSIAFHQDFAANGELYASYTRPGGSGITTLSRFIVADPAAGVPDPGSEQILFSLQQPFSNHNGGLIKFAPDGYLWFGLGDGGSGGDPLNHGQNKNTLLGAMLRLDIDVPSGYAIPADNPFVDADGADEIWSYGLRNPWRWSFDRANGNVWIADVGQNVYEEVNFEPAGLGAGRNYGWRAWEAYHMYNQGQALSPDTAGMTFPIYSYTTGQNCAITGGYVYRGSEIPALEGWYLFSDYCSGRLWGLMAAVPAPIVYELTSPGNLVSSFGEDEDGELYMVRLNGNVVRIIEG